MAKDTDPDSITLSELRDAVNAGVIANQAGQDLLAFIAKSRAAPNRADEESFRFIRSFNDIFVTIAICLVLYAVLFLTRSTWGTISAAGFSVAATSWLLAEYFSRKRRMAFPSIVLVITFVGGVFFGMGGTQSVALAGLGMAVATAAHWWRFGVPITLAAGVAALVVLALALARDNAIVMLSCGVGVLAAAIAIDALDRYRVSRNTDIAFWMHLLAAPLIVHGAFSLLLRSWYGLPDGGFLGFGRSLTFDDRLAVVAVVFYLGFSLLALVIDRRALMVSSLIYLLYATYHLITDSTASGGEAAAMTALIVGLFLLFVSAGWAWVRSIVMQIMPAWVRQRVPPSP